MAWFFHGLNPNVLHDYCKSMSETPDKEPFQDSERLSRFWISTFLKESEIFAIWLFWVMVLQKWDSVSIQENIDNSPHASQQAVTGDKNSQVSIHDANNSRTSVKVEINNSPPPSPLPKVEKCEKKFFKSLIKVVGFVLILWLGTTGFYFYKDSQCKQKFTDATKAKEIKIACNISLMLSPLTLKFRDIKALISRAQANAVLGKYT